nr:MAG TPA: TNF receptor-associated factor 6 zinc finger 2 [Caudoviricetes sp.]
MTSFLRYYPNFLCPFLRMPDTDSQYGLSCPQCQVPG